jgi:hypothetical protein
MECQLSDLKPTCLSARGTSESDMLELLVTYLHPSLFEHQAVQTRESRP